MGVIAAIIGGLLALVALMLFFWVVLVVLKFIAVAIGGAVIGGAIGLIVAGLGLDIALACGAGLISGILAAFKLCRVIPGPGQKEPSKVPPATLEVQSMAHVKYDGPIESEANKMVRSAWLKLTDLVPNHKHENIHQVRSRCAQLLAMSEASLDLKLVEWTAHFRRTFPALADEYVSHWRYANKVKQNQLIEAIMVDLQNIEKYANQTWSAIQSNKGDDLTIIRNHVAQKASGS